MILLNTITKLPGSLKWYFLVKIALIMMLLAFALSMDYWFFGSIGKAIAYTAQSFMSVFLVLGIPFWLYSVLFYKFISFIVKEKTVEINVGIIFKGSRVIPFERIHNIDISKGPLSKAFGLSKIKIWTEGDIQTASVQKKHRPISLWLQTSDSDWLREYILGKQS